MLALVWKVVILVLMTFNTNILLAAATSVAPGTANNSLYPLADNRRPVILVVGDSISAAYGIQQSQGWVSLLEKKLIEKNFSHEVVNASVSGNTSADGLRRLPKLLKQYNPSIVVVELGGNDGLRGYPVKLMKKNLQKMIDMSESKSAEVLLAGIEIPPNYGVRYTTLFREVFQTLAATNSHIQFEPFILDGVATRPELMQADGLHPTAEAQPQLLVNIWDNLYPLLTPKQ
jgi:acyl-CoA thioesterase-1